VADLSPPEPDGDLHPVAVVEKLSGSSRLHLEIVDVDLDAQAHFLEGLRLLLLLLFAFALLELVLVLAVVQDPANGRNRGGCDLHEIESPFLGEGEGLCRRHDAELLTLIIDDAHLSDADHLIDAEFPCQRLLSFNNKTTWPITDGWPCKRTRIAGE
jgi:hypothetical protein